MGEKEKNTIVRLRKNCIFATEKSDTAKHCEVLLNFTVRVIFCIQKVVSQLLDVIMIT